MGTEPRKFRKEVYFCRGTLQCDEHLTKFRSSAKRNAVKFAEWPKVLTVVLLCVTKKARIF